MAENVIKKNNPELWQSIVRVISHAPDPRPISAKQFGDIWNTDAAWSRLMNELEGIALGGTHHVVNDAEFLQRLQDSTLTNVANLAMRTQQWIGDYPMIAWSLTITAPAEYRNACVAIGDITTVKMSYINKTLISHIRDIRTARALRSLRKKSLVAFPIKMLAEAVTTRDIGVIYAALIELDDTIEVSALTAIDKNIDKRLIESISEALLNQPDEEALIPFVEHGVLDLTYYIDKKIVIMNEKGRNGSSARRFLTYIATKYIHTIIKDENNDDIRYATFFRSFGLHGSLNLDPQLAEMIVNLVITIPDFTKITIYILQSIAFSEHSAARSIISDAIMRSDSLYDLSNVTAMSIAHDDPIVSQRYITIFKERFRDAKQSERDGVMSDNTNVWLLWNILDEDYKVYYASKIATPNSNIIKELSTQTNAVIRKAFIKKFPSNSKTLYSNFFAVTSPEEHITFFWKLVKRDTNNVENWLNILPVEEIMKIWSSPLIGILKTGTKWVIKTLNKFVEAPYDIVVTAFREQWNTNYKFPSSLITRAIRENREILEGLSVDKLLRYAQISGIPLSELAPTVKVDAATIDSFNYTKSFYKSIAYAPVEPTIIDYQAALEIYVKYVVINGSRSHYSLLKILESYVRKIIKNGADPSYNNGAMVLLLTKTIYIQAYRSLISFLITIPSVIAVLSTPVVMAIKEIILKYT